MTVAATRLRRDERWAADISPIRRFSKPMVLLAFASLLAHAAIFLTAVLADHAVVAPSTEIRVEIVTEVPKPAVEMPKPFELAKAQPAAPKSEPFKSEPFKTEPLKTEPPKHDTAKVERIKAEAPKAETQKAETRKLEPPPRSPRKVEAARTTPPAPKLDDEERKLADLQRELASLRAEQAALEAERAAPAPQPIGLRDSGLGPLPESFQAVALPTASGAAGEAVGYRDLVFSALAKAKGIGRTQGLPGSAGVHFEIDAAGRLLDVALMHQSGVPSLDAEALDIVRRAAPFPPPPQGAQRSFDANVNFVTESAQ